MRAASRTVSMLAGILALLATAIAASGQTPPFKPTVGQAGKDVVWVPTPTELIDAMLDLANLIPSDVVIDLGSGDGRMVNAAARRGARAIGIEFSRDMVALSQRNAAAAGLGDRARFVQGDLFTADLSNASVITMFLLPEINIRLRPKLLELRPGTRIVSNTFDMGDWSADRTSRLEKNCSRWCQANLWIVPARVEGEWKVPDGILTVAQKYQMVAGTLRRGNQTIAVRGRLIGDELVLMVGDTEYRARVERDSLLGSDPEPWRGARSDPADGAASQGPKAGPPAPGPSEAAAANPEVGTASEPAGGAGKASPDVAAGSPPGPVGAPDGGGGSPAPAAAEGGSPTVYADRSSVFVPDETPQGGSPVPPRAPVPGPPAAAETTAPGGGTNAPTPPFGGSPGGGSVVTIGPPPGTVRGGGVAAQPYTRPAPSPVPIGKSKNPSSTITGAECIDACTGSNANAQACQRCRDAAASKAAGGPPPSAGVKQKTPAKMPSCSQSNGRICGHQKTATGTTTHWCCSPWRCNPADIKKCLPPQ